MLLSVSNSSEDSFRLDNLINQQHKKFDEIIFLDKGKPLVSIGVWCLMSNHFHLLIRQEVDGGITKFMRKLGVGYSMYFNIKYQRQGALFGGLFKSKLIGDKDNYLKYLFGYIHLNPLDINFSGWENLIDKKNPKDWKDFLESYTYSSYQDYVGVKRPEGKIIKKDAFPDYFEQENSFNDFMSSFLSFD